MPLSGIMLPERLIRKRVLIYGIRALISRLIKLSLF